MHNLKYSLHQYGSGNVLLRAIEGKIQSIAGHPRGVGYRIPFGIGRRSGRPRGIGIEFSNGLGSWHLHKK
jgi:hypothetical protein